MKIYISLPITWHDIEQVEARSIFTAAMLREQGHTPISPLELEHRDPEDYEAVIGTDITALLCCDAVYFCKDWETSRSCRLEYQAAKIYGKEIILEQ